MTNALAIVFLIVILGPVLLSAETFAPCTGPQRAFISYVVHKQEQPPVLGLIPGPGTRNQKPCASPVDPSVTEEPSWQLLEPANAVEVDLTAGATIVTLHIVPDSVVPNVVKEAARRQGLNIK